MNLIDIIVETTKAISENAKNVDAYKQRAIALIQMEQLDEAVKDLDMLINRLKVQDAEVYQLRAGIRMQKADKNGALADLQVAMKLNPQLLEMLNGRFQSAEGKSCHED